MKKRIFAAIIAFIMAAAVMLVTLAKTTPDALAETAPDALSEITPYWTVPDGYNVHDYNKAVTFLEQADENGVKNGEKIAEYAGLVYDPEDPDTWGRREQMQPDGSWIWIPLLDWIEADDGQLHLFRVLVNNIVGGYGVVGPADFSWCTSLFSIQFMEENITEINIRGCSAVQYGSAYDCWSLTEFDVTGCSSLTYLDIRQTAITSFDLPFAEHLHVLRYGANPYLNINESNSRLSFPELLEIDVSGLPQLTNLDLTNCPSLTTINCWDCNLTEIILPTEHPDLSSLNAYGNHLTELELGNSPALGQIDIDGSDLQELDLSQCPNLNFLDCHSNKLTELDVSMCPLLQTLDCKYCPLRELDLSNNQLLPFDGIEAAGEGTIGCDFYYTWSPSVGAMVQIAFVYAECSDGTEFLGWYNEDDELLSTIQDGFDCAYLVDSETVLIARFSGGETLPGDVDGDGEVSVSDALLALRGAMGVLELTPEQEAIGDMNGDGTVSVDDALVILRTAMGLI